MHVSRIGDGAAEGEHLANCYSLLKERPFFFLIVATGM